VKNAGDMLSGDKWAPISDTANDWVQISADAAHKQCWTHAELGHGYPDWGIDGDGVYGRKMCCSTGSPGSEEP